MTPEERLAKRERIRKLRHLKKLLVEAAVLWVELFELDVDIVEAGGYRPRDVDPDRLWSGIVDARLARRIQELEAEGGDT